MSELEKAYRERFELVLKPLAKAIEEQLREYFDGHPRIDRITARAKSVERFLEKAQKEEDGKRKYTEPLHQIQDQVGARVVIFYLSDVEPTADIINKYYRSIESRDIIPESEWKFGYFGRHFVSIVPSDLVLQYKNSTHVPKFFELQVKTLFQHAWSEANHDLGYKPDSKPLNADATRRLAFTSAQAWGADRIFNELFVECQKAP